MSTDQIAGVATNGEDSADIASIKKLLAALVDHKEKAVDEEDFEQAEKLKKDIEALEADLKRAQSGQAAEASTTVNMPTTNGDNDGEVPAKTSSGFTVGDEVSAAYHDGHMYLATVTRILSNEEVEVNYSEYDEKAVVKASDVKLDGGAEGKRMSKNPTKEEQGIDAEVTKLAAMEVEVTGLVAMEVQEKGEKKALQRAQGRRSPVLPATAPLWCYGAAPLGLSWLVFAGTGLGLFTIFVLSVVLTLPETVSCHPEDEKYFVVLINAPLMTRVEPPMVCTAEVARELTLQGRDFLVYNGSVPSVRVDGVELAFDARAQCKELDVRGQEVQMCAQFNLTVPFNDSHLEIHNATILLTDFHPEAPHATATISDALCEHETFAELVVVPPPRVIDVWPAAVCRSRDLAYTLTLTGTHLVYADSPDFGEEKPEVFINKFRVAANDTAMQQCTAFYVGSRGYTSVQNCEQMLINITSDDYQDLNTVSARAIAPLECTAIEAAEFRVVSPPEVTAATPSLVCTDEGEQQVTLEGSGFLHVDGAWPSVRMDAVSLLVTPSSLNTTADGCVQLPVKGHVVHTCTRLTVTLPRKAVQTPYYPSFEVIPPYDPACARTFAEPLLVVPPPSLYDTLPPLACAADAVVLALDGAYYYRVAGLAPVVRVNGEEVPSRLEQCEPAGSTATHNELAQQCTRLVAQVEGGLLVLGAVGNNTLSITNPYPASCTLNTTLPVLVVERPAARMFSPPLACVVEGPGTTNMTVSGVFVVDGQVPSFSLSSPSFAGSVPASVGTCQTVQEGVSIPYVGGTHTIQECSRVELVLPQLPNQSAVEQPSIAVHLTLGPNCTLQAVAELVLVPKPLVLSTAFPAVCSGTTSAQELVFQGLFVTVQGTKPTFSISPNYGALKAADVLLSDCTPLNATGVSAELCKVAILSVTASNFLPSGNYLSVTNPPPVACSFLLSSQDLLVTPPPQVSSVLGNNNICMDTLPQRLELLGSFLRVRDSVPSVTVEGVSGENVELDPLFCENSFIGSTQVQNCTRLSFDVSALTPRTIGLLALRLSMTCGVDFDSYLVGFTTPTVARALPPRICVNVTTVVAFEGTGFFSSPSTSVEPELTVGAATPSFLKDACFPVGREGSGLSECRLLNATIVANTVSPGIPNVTVGKVPGCDSPVATPLLVEPLPYIDRIEPYEYCVDQDVTLTIHGNNLSPLLVYTQELPSRQQQVTPPPDNITAPVPPPNLLVGDVFTVFWDHLSLSSPDSGKWDATVTNINGCSFTKPQASYVHGQLLVFFVDPPVVYNKIRLQVTIFTTGLESEVQRIEFFPPNYPIDPSYVFLGNESSVDYQRDELGNPRYNRITIQLPLDMVTGSYSIKVTSRIGCLTTASNVLDVTSTALPDLLAVLPTHVWFNRSSSVVVTSSADAFQDGLRAYLTPIGTGGAQATSLRAAVVKSQLVLSAVVPAGLTPGNYTLVVVNQDKSVHIFPSSVLAALVVTDIDVPRIDSVSPVAVSDGKQLTITGTNFGVLPTIALDCSGLSRVIMGTMSGNVITISAANVPSGSYCVVILIRASDEAATSFAAVAFSNPSSKLNPFFPNTASTTPPSVLLAAVRGCSLGTISVTDSSRFLLALGGDTSTGATTVSPVATVQAAPLRVDGVPGTFRALKNSLPRPLAFAGATVVGRFVYLFGGQSGNSSSSALYRSYILSPLETSGIDLDLQLVPVFAGSNTTRTPFSDGGLYFYAVSAKFGPSDANNPDGESLPGEVLNVNLPNITSAATYLNLNWASIPNAVGYYLYRTPMRGSPLSSLTLLAETVSPKYDDDGGAGPNSTSGRVPLIEGELGKWREMGAGMGVGRFAHGFTHVRNPSKPSELVLLAAMGSTSALPNLGAGIDATYSICKVVEAAATQPRGSYTQNLTSCSASVALGTTGRAGAAALAITSANAGITPGGSGAWIVLTAGQTANAASSLVDFYDVNFTTTSLISAVQRDMGAKVPGNAAIWAVSSGQLYGFSGAALLGLAAAGTNDFAGGSFTGKTFGTWSPAGFPDTTIANIEGNLPSIFIAWAGFTDSFGRWHFCGGVTATGQLTNACQYSTII